MTLRSGDTLRIALGVLVISGERSDAACREGIQTMHRVMSVDSTYFYSQNKAFSALGGLR